MLNINELTSVVDSIKSMEDCMDKQGVQPFKDKSIALHNEGRELLMEVKAFLQKHCLPLVENVKKEDWKDCGNYRNCIKRYRLGTEADNRFFYWVDNTLGFTVQNGEVTGVSVADSSHIFPCHEKTEWHHFDPSYYSNNISPVWDNETVAVKNARDSNVKELVKCAENYHALGVNAVRMLPIFLRRVAESVKSRQDERNAILDNHQNTVKFTITITEG